MIDYHYRYAEKSGTSVDDENMKDFLIQKADAAEDILNESLDILDECTASDVEGNKQTEITLIKRETAMNEEIIIFVVYEISKI